MITSVNACLRLKMTDLSFQRNWSIFIDNIFFSFPRSTKKYSYRKDDGGFILFETFGSSTPKHETGI